MCPTLPSFNSAYGVLKNTIIGGNQFLQTSILSDFINLFLRKFCRAASFTSICGAVFNFVCVVIFRSIPTKITQIIILRIPIIVATLHSFGSFTNKRFHNKFVWSNNDAFIVFPQSKVRSWIVFVYGRFFYLSGKNRPYLPTIRHFVNAFKTYYIAPFFHNNPHIKSIGIL